MPGSYRQALRLAMRVVPIPGAAAVFQVPEMRKLSFPVRRLAMVAAVAALTALSACSALPTAVVKVHQIDVVQGNVVTREQAQALRPGQAKALVRDILGSPLVASVFHADRWDYVFSFSRQGQAAQQRRFTVYFKDGALERFEGADLPSEAEFVASLDRRPPTGPVPTLQASEEQLKALPASAPVAPATPPAEPARRTFPPLESTGAPR
jgi:outer membrane protein assembly factor BamE